MSNNPLLQTDPEQNVPPESSKAKKEATEAGAKPSSSSVPQMRDLDFATYDEAGNTLSHTRIVELVRPNEMNNFSVVAVTKQDNPPYLAEVNLSSQDILLQVESQDPFFIGGGAAIPALVNIPIRPESEERTSFPVTGRMVKIPLQTTSRDPNSRGRDPNISNSHDFSGSRDPEKDAPVKNMTYAPGYPSTAAIMSTDPELSVYRRFDRLNARNLLYYQAELMYIEAELDKLDDEDRMTKESEAKYHLKHFKELWEASDARTIKRRNLIMDMRYLLKEYNTAMYYYKELLNSSEPSDRVTTSIRNWRANQGDPPIIDISETAYDKPYEPDLMALKPPKSDDPITIFVQNNLGKFFKKPKPPHIPNSDNVLYYSETAIDLFVTIICTLLAIVVLVGSMTTLYFVESSGLRLGLVWVFTFLFAISIFLMANLSKGEIFLATAAYCAILVVYISGG